MKFRWETEFKETEIGEIPRDWEVKRLGEVFDYVKGLSYKSSEINYAGNGQIFITLDNFLRGGGFKKEFSKYYHGNKYRREHKVYNGDLIIALTDMTSDAKVVGAPAIVNFQEKSSSGLISLDCAKLIPKINVSLKYYEAYLSMTQEENSRFANGVNVLHLDIKNFMDQKLIPLPSLPEQTRIATVLSWFDDLMENKKKQNEILEKMAMAIFKSWFVDFEPFQDEEFVYNEELGREIPKGWGVRAIKEVANISDGVGYKNEDLDEEFDYNNFLLITLNNILEGGGFKPEYRFLNINTDKIREDKVVRELDIVLANKEQTKDGRLLGSPAIVFFPVYYTKSIALFSCNNTRVVPLSEQYRFLLYLDLKINQPYVAEVFHGGTSVWYLHTKSFKDSYKIPLPPLPILQRFHSLVEPLFQKIILNQKQIMTLRKIRDTLLPLLVFGKLRVEEI